MSFNFKAAVTICSDFGAQENSVCYCFHCFPIFALNWCFWTAVLEKTLEHPVDCKEIQPVHLKGYQSRIFNGRTDSNTLATWCKELAHWKRPWCWERLKAGGEGDNRGWDGWMASLTQWTWLWLNSRSWFLNLEPVCYSMSGSNCCFLTCIQISQEAVRWSDIPISWRIFQFVVIHTAKGYGIVNKAETDVFLKCSCFFDDPADVGNLISGSSAFSKISLNIWKLDRKSVV